MPYNETETETRERRFWLGMLYAALAGYAGAAIALSGYVILTHNQAHRDWMMAVVGVALGAALAMYCFRQRIVGTWHRVWVFATWNTASFGFVALLCLLDGGINSPIIFLYVVPMLYLGIGFPLRAVWISGAIGLAGCAMLIALNTGPVYGPTNMLQLMTLSIGWLLAMIGAANRNNQEQAMRRLRERLETLAATDELTGCLNQRAFMIAMRREISRAVRYRHSVALLVIDIDYFKEVNDRHGHQMGDSVLCQVGAILRGSARDADLAGRPGGDEMALLVPETDRASAFALAERLRKQMTVPPLPIDITLSIGVSVSDADNDDVGTLYRRADQALYAAKRRGRNQVAIWGDTDAVSR